MSEHDPAAGRAKAELLSYIEQVLDTFRDRFGFVHLNRPDPDLGVLDRERVARLIEAAGEKLAERCFAEAGQAHANARGAMMLFRAVPGWNRDEVTQAIRQRTQIAIRAFGLLPLREGQAGRDECYARYLLLRGYERTGLQFAAQRRSTEQAAVQAALANLAQTAGFSDPTRLVWAMESELAARAASHATSRAGDVTLTLVGEGLESAVHASRNGTPLPSVPSAIKKSKTYTELRARADELRAQFLRLRADFERLMVESEPFQSNELAELATLPALGQMLSRLVFRDAKNAFGLYDRERNGFTGPEGARVELAGECFIAHPLDLENARQLQSWQREIVRRRIVQPFKQVFRETYTDSPHIRMAGQALAARAAGKWLNDRGWQMQLGDLPEQVQVVRPYAGSSVQAVITFDAPERLLAGKGDVELRMLAFRTLADRDEQPGRLAPSDIPARIRSETYRDADLLACEALRGRIRMPSREVLARRAEMVAALAHVLPLRCVQVHETFAEVATDAATCTISLVDAQVSGGDPSRITPSERWSEAKDLYLPFPGSDDAILAEAVHRIVWFCRHGRG